MRCYNSVCYRTRACLLCSFVFPLHLVTRHGSRRGKAGIEGEFAYIIDNLDPIPGDPETLVPDPVKRMVPCMQCTQRTFVARGQVRGDPCP